MRFYTQQHQYYCGIDLHARTMYNCILDQAGDTVLHKNINTKADLFLKIIEPYRDNLAVSAECIFTWYWLADLCAQESIPFVLGHALYMKAIHGAKTKNDRIDSYKIAKLLRAGMIPMAYVYPAKMRAGRDLLRRRMHFMRKRAELRAHIKNTNSQYNLPPLGTSFPYRAKPNEVKAQFTDSCVRKSVQVDLGLIDYYDKILKDLELYIHRSAKHHDAKDQFLLRTIPGIGPILSLVLLYEIENIGRFPRVQDFASYARLIKPTKESAGKRAGKSNKKIGNAHLKWAFSEAAILMMRERDEAKKFVQRKQSKHGKAKAIAILSHKIGRAVYYMLKHQNPFDPNKFFNKS